MCLSTKIFSTTLAKSTNIGNTRYYIQSAYAILNEEKGIQETRGLLKIDDSFKKVVIMKDCYIPWYDDNGVYYIGLEHFLLDKDSLEK